MITLGSGEKLADQKGNTRQIKGSHGMAKEGTHSQIWYFLSRLQCPPGSLL